MNHEKPLRKEKGALFYTNKLGRLYEKFK